MSDFELGRSLGRDETEQRLKPHFEKQQAENARLTSELENALEHRYTPMEVARWLSAYDGKYREKTLTEWVRDFREQEKAAQT